MKIRSTVTPSRARATLVALAIFFALPISGNAYAQTLDAKVEPIKVRDIEQPHVDVLVNFKRNLESYQGALAQFTPFIENEAKAYNACADDYCRTTQLITSAEARNLFANAIMSYAINVRDIGTTQIQSLIETHDKKADAYFDGFVVKRDNFVSNVMSTLESIEANIQSQAEFEMLSSDKQMAVFKFAQELDKALYDLKTMAQELDMVERTQAMFASKQADYLAHANTYELHAGDISIQAFKQTRSSDLLRVVGEANMLANDLDTIAHTLNTMPAPPVSGFMPTINVSQVAMSSSEVSIPQPSRSIDMLFSGSLRQDIESLMGITRN
jgi:hypothetical protein